MLNILITGATGNVGIEVIRALKQLPLVCNIIAAVRDIGADVKILIEYNITLVRFDLTDISSFNNALQNIDVVFLMRPPKISAVKKYFQPFISNAVEAKVKHIVFLSVQGVEKSRIIPHHKIEQLIEKSKIPFTFLRPAYFMQNFTTTLRNDLVFKRRIFLPAGHAKFTLVDVRDIGNVAAFVISNSASHLNKQYELTCHQKLNFLEIAEKLSDGLGITIVYKSPSLINFFTAKRKEKIPFPFIMVMIMLHYLPRFQKEPHITDCIKAITDRDPISFDNFIKDNVNILTPV